ncbi:MAG TPA: hypothetical protein VMS56_05345 [Thermoanaerobaculia bacterium]|nr:hypothetical protein [Thermoanaerobaculia bacterium]
MPRFLPFLALLVLLSPVWARGADIPLAESRLGAAAGEKRGNALGQAGDRLLSIWKEEGPALSGAVLDSFGTRLEGFRIQLESASLVQPTGIASDGERLLVVGREGSITTRSLLVDRAGRLIRGPRDLPIPASHPAGVAWSNGRYLAISAGVNQGGGPAGIFGVLLDADGLPQGSVEIDAAFGATVQSTDVVATDLGFEIAWETPSSVMLSAVSSAGSVGPSGVIATKSGEGSLSSVRIARSGPARLVVWMDRHPVGPAGSRPNLLARVIEPDGELGDVLELDRGSTFDSIAVSGNAEGWLVAGSDVLNVNSAAEVDTVLWSISPAGEVFRIVAPPSSRATDLAIVPLGSGFFLTGRRQIAGAAEDDILGMTWRDGGSEPSPVRLLSLGIARQRSPLGARAGAVALAGWTERLEDGVSHVILGRVDPTAGPVDGTGIAVPFSGSNQLSPAISSDGSEFLVVWSEEFAYRAAAIRAVRVTADLEILDETPVTLSTDASASAPDAAWSGDSWIVAWAGRFDYRIHVRRIAPNGTQLGSLTIDRASRNRAEAAPIVDCNGTHCLLVWRALPFLKCAITCPPDPWSVEAIRLTRELEQVDPEPRILGERATYPGKGLLAVRWNPTAGAWLIAWPGPSGVRMAGNGEMLDSTLASWIVPAMNLSAIAEGAGWRLVWAVRSGTLITSTVTRGMDLGSHLRPRIVHQSAFPETNPSLIDAPRPILLFVREDPELDGAPRARARFLDETDGPDLSLTLTIEKTAPAEVRLEWNAPPPDTFAIDLERQTASGSWVRVDQYPPDRTSAVISLDAEIHPPFRVIARLPSWRIVSNEIRLGRSRPLSR